MKRNVLKPRILSKMAVLCFCAWYAADGGIRIQSDYVGVYSLFVQYMCKIRLSAVMDKVNKRYGRDKLHLASQMYNPDWPMKQTYLSPRYTTWQ